MDTAKVGTGRTGLGTFLVLFATVCMSTEAVAAKIAYEAGYGDDCPTLGAILPLLCLAVNG